MHVVQMGIVHIIREIGDCPGNIENCEYRQQRNDAFINYTFDGI